jgi:hypothetical protein
MAWLYLPVSVGLNSVSDNCSLNQELSVSWRGKSMQVQSLSRKWKKDKFMKLLYGMILHPSTAQSLAEKWISLLPDSLANHGQMLENYRKPKTKDGFGMTSKESFAKLDLDSSSWKTSQVSLMGELTSFLSPWPQSGSMLNGVVSKSRKLAETITETEFLSSDIYPTPTASQITTEGTTRLYRNLFLNGILTLEEATAMNGNYNPLKKKGALEMFPIPNMADGMRTNLTHQRGMADAPGQRRGKIQAKRKISNLEMSYGPSWWQTEPSIRRVVDGLAFRVDRLRACGNGVVPYQAYRAFAELISRAIERGDLIES